MNQLELLAEISARLPGKSVSCPRFPLAVTGVSLNTFTAGDAFGLLMVIEVPKSGVIYSATFYDRDDEGSQMDMEVFNYAPAQVASEDAWTLSAEDNPKFVDELSFVAFDDHTATQTSKLTNIGVAYSAPEGKLWIQMVCRGTPDMASTLVVPMLQLQILSDDPTWQER